MPRPELTIAFMLDESSAEPAHEQVLSALITAEPTAKCQRTLALDAEALADALASTSTPSLATERLRAIPGRPDRPQLVPPREVATRGLGTPAGRIALAHAVAHIEFNAINLALDACWRFAGQMPAAFYRDWIGVARDEARHFLMMRQRLNELGADYGDLPAHNGLWEAAEKTAHDVLVRMALVPRVLEARGLDVTPGMIVRLREVGDLQTIAVLEVILTEEVGHVRAGTRWFHHLCAQRGLPPVTTFRQLLREHRMSLRPPFNLSARSEAGFVPEELIETDTP